MAIDVILFKIKYSELGNVQQKTERCSKRSHWFISVSVPNCENEKTKLPNTTKLLTIKYINVMQTH